MSLRIWLPLNGNLENQGLSDLKFSIRNAEYTQTNNSGKIGVCYENTAHNNGGIVSDKMIDLGSKQSMCCWINMTDVYSSSSLMGIGGQHRFSANTGMGLTIRYVSATTGYLSVNTGNGSSRTYNTYYGTTLMSTGKWYHVCYTYDGSVVKLYVDGELDATHTVGALSVPAEYVSVFMWSYNHNNYMFSGLINDFRCYDHVLSPAEVKEISKGLVLHYPLNRDGFGGDNLIITNSRTPSSGTSGWSKAGTNWENSNVVSSGASTGRAIRCTYSGTTQRSGGIHHPTGNTKGDLTDGAYYTLSARIRASKNCRASFHNELQGANTINLTTDWKVYSFSDVIDNSHTYHSNTIYVAASDVEQNMWIECDWIKLEEGSTATPWLPNSSDPLYSEMGLDSTTEYDCSGYKHNGEKIGALTYTSDTPRYHISTHIGETTQKIHIPNLTTVGFGDSYSFAWWGKRSSNSPMFWGFSDGIRLNGMYLGTLWNTGDGLNNPLYNIGTTTQVTAPSTGVWHHYVMTGNGTKCYVYLDGELWAEAKTYKAISGTSIYINGWNSSTTYCSNDTSISDFRIYSTALDADSVRSLYNTAASIADNGTILTYEFEEA